MAEAKKERKVEVLYCVKVKKYKNGFLKKVIEKKFFDDLKNAKKYYDKLELSKHIIIELSVYIDMNERYIYTKGNK